jgi:hypothetical protein
MTVALWAAHQMRVLCTQYVPHVTRQPRGVDALPQDAEVAVPLMRPDPVCNCELGREIH